MSTGTLARHSLNGHGGNAFMNSETGLAPLNGKMNLIFDRVFNFFPYRADWVKNSQVMPHIDMADCGDTIQVLAECPGMEQRDLDISWANGTLTIKGKKQSIWDKESTSLYLSERIYGNFHREISLPVEIDVNAVEAFYKNGVLVITLPKSQEAKKQVTKIAIATE